MSKEAMKLALEALEDTLSDDPYPYSLESKAITALKEALAEQPAQQDSTCSNALRAQGKAYPRTCKKCGLGPCVELAQQALDKMAENARELGLDYEPAQQKPVTRVNLDMTGAMATLPKTGSESVVEYKPVDEHVCIYNECGFCEDPDCNVHGDADVQVTMPPMTNEGADANTPLSPQPKGTGKITLHESKPAQRTWVGLTDEERVDLWKATETDNRMVLIEAIEAKLKEKNNG